MVESFLGGLDFLPRPNLPFYPIPFTLREATPHIHDPRRLNQGFKMTINTPIIDEFPLAH